jgi:hypothetical protein|tara:strand:- start:281 stop:445 length:165 start_codon:yes stop_codon:yes gene_type:complete
LLELGIQFAKAMKNNSLAQKGQNLLDRFNISAATIMENEPLVPDVDKIGEVFGE